MGKPSRVRVTGPLEPYAFGFRKELARNGYTLNSASYQLQLMAHASRWLADQGLDTGELTPARVEEFLAARRAEGYVLWLSAKAMVPMLEYLRGRGVLQTPMPAPLTELEQLLEDYRGYLISERGLAASTVRSYIDVAHLFLSQRPEPNDLDLNDLRPAELIEFVLRECRVRSRGSTEYVVTGLRALLRFLYVDGRTTMALAAVIPTAPSWRLRSLPRYLEAAEVSRLLNSCDRRTATGRRDFAILTLLVRLGLRRGEAARLRLSDIDWRSGEFVVCGKGRREERLPLPVDVGEAIVGWLRRGRPSCQFPNVFLRVHAPTGPMSPAAVSHVVKAAATRAGLEGVNAHRLRHTAATQMLRAGAGLEEIGQVLRQRSPLTVSTYAKVDHASLSQLALPWPGGVA